MTTTESGADRAEIRARMTGLVSRYPAISGDELAELKAWFREGASSLDIGLVASEEGVGDGYRAFRAEHVDRFELKDIGVGLAMIAVLTLVIGGIGWMAP